ncbi:MAG: hypothetical protein WBD36_04790 [Bacteroidota bacterium]
MPRVSILKLQRILHSVLSSSQTEQQTNEIVKLCHAMAVSFLMSKLSSRRLNPSFAGLKITDLAFDCIADLFQRDAGGRLVQLSAYFGSISIAELSDEALTGHLRRLVFSKVNNNIFRIYNEVDPTLGKILRNIKLTVHALGHFVEFERFGEPYLAPANVDPLSRLPQPDPEVLSRNLRQQKERESNIPGLLSALSCYLRDQEEHAREIPLMTVAYVLRSHFAKPDVLDAEISSAEGRLLENDVRTIIEEVCQRLKLEKHDTYVGKNKLKVAEYESYMEVIVENLHATLVQDDGTDFPFYNRLKSRLTPLSKGAYRKRHKNKLEYLARIARDRVIEKLKRLHAT